MPYIVSNKVNQSILNNKEFILEILSDLQIENAIKKIQRRVVGNVLNNISPSNIFEFCFCLRDSIKIVRLLLAAVSISDLCTLLSVSSSGRKNKLYIDAWSK